MKLTNKLIITFTMLLTLLGSVMLIATGDEVLQSQSAYALADNVIWYIMIHVGMIMSFFFLNASFKGKWMYGVVAFASIATLALDMYGYKWHHNIATVIIFLSASYCIIWYTHVAFRKPYFITCLILGIGFILALTTNLWTVYEIETIIEWSFSIMLLSDLYLKK